MPKRRPAPEISLSFLDVICCGFGAVILLLMITKTVEPQVLEESTVIAEGRVAELTEQLFEIRGETTVLNRDLAAKREQISEFEEQIAILQGSLASSKSRYDSLQTTRNSNSIVAEQLAIARQELSDEEERLLGRDAEKKNQLIGGIPVDSEYIIFIIDTSGSMSGTSFHQARSALRMALRRLSPADTFNVIAFSSSARQLFRRALPATSENIAKAISNIEGLEAKGGTEMLSALTLALHNSPASERVRQVVFITDGAVGNESALFDYISLRIGKSRLFTIGIGSAPNAYFMKRAARAGRGTFTYIGTPEEVHEKMSGLFAYLESPMLTDIRLHWPGRVDETYPAPIPDLYAGEPLVVVVKAKDLGSKLSITGMRSGKPWRQSVSLEDGIAKSGVARLYARRKIESFSLNASDLQAALGYEDTRKYLRQKIIETGLRYHLVTRHTSLVAVEDESTRPEEKPLKAWPVPTHLPAGWELEEIWLKRPEANDTAGRVVSAKNASYAIEREVVKKGSAEKGKRNAEERVAAQTMMAAHLPRTATSAPLFMIIGLLLLITAFFLGRRIRARW